MGDFTDSQRKLYGKWMRAASVIANNSRFGYKQDLPGYLLVPYILMEITPVPVIDYGRLYSRYAEKKINPNFYSSLRVVSHRPSELDIALHGNSMSVEMTPLSAYNRLVKYHHNKLSPFKFFHGYSK